MDTKLSAGSTRVTSPDRMTIIFAVIVLVLLCVLIYVFLQLPSRSAVNVTVTPGSNVASQKVGSTSYVTGGVSKLYVITGTITPTAEATTTTATFSISGLDPKSIVAHHENLSALATNTAAFGNLPYDAPSRSLTVSSTGVLTFTFVSNSTNVHTYTLYLYV